MPDPGPDPIARETTILVVEDDADILDAVAFFLKTSGYRVEEATNGLVALRRLRRDPPVDLVLLDLLMPIMDGAAFCAERARDPRIAEIPVVLLTAYADNGEPAVDRLGAQAIVRKPIQWKQLLQTIAGLVDGSRRAGPGTT